MEFPDLSQDYYFYPFISKNGYVTIKCLYDVELDEYDSARFRYDEDGAYVRFDGEDEALEWLNKNIKLEKIDEEYAFKIADNSMWAKYMK